MPLIGSLIQVQSASRQLKELLESSADDKAPAKSSIKTSGYALGLNLYEHPYLDNKDYNWVPQQVSKPHYCFIAHYILDVLIFLTNHESSD